MDFPPSQPPRDLPRNARWRTASRLALLAAIWFPATAGAQIWSEEFDSGSAPDAAVWSHDFGAGGWGNSELQTYTDDPANVKVEGGHLVITAVRQGNGFTSARIKTEDKLTFQYGTVEARIKVPDLADGLWPAFWTLGNNFSSAGWPACGEIDVLEMGSGSAIAANLVNRRVQSTAHWEFNDSYAGYGSHNDRPADIDGSWHVYRMEWTPTTITTFIDGNFIWAIDISDPQGSDMTEFHQPHFFLLNMAVGGTFPGIFHPGGITAPLPAEYVIDYVRIFDNGFTMLGGSSLAPPPGTNLLANPGFETGTTGWGVNATGGAVGASTSRARTGSRSLRIDNAGAGVWSAPQASQSFPAAPGDVIHFQGYMLSPSPITDGSFGLLKIVFKNSAGNDLLPASAEAGSINTDFPGIESTPFLNGSSVPDQWALTTARGEAPPGTTQVVLFVLNVNPPESATAMHFDDLAAWRVGDPVLPVALSVALAGTDIELRFPTQVGVVYEVASKNSLSDATWTVVDTVTGDGSTRTLTYPQAAAARFYIVRVP